MATELSRSFDTVLGAVFSKIKDAPLGNVTAHTYYLTGPQAVTDVDAAIAQTMATLDADAQTLKDRMIAAGWKPSGN